jgi:hypothetical protein
MKCVDCDRPAHWPKGFPINCCWECYDVSQQGHDSRKGDEFHDDECNAREPHASVPEPIRSIINKFAGLK